MKLRYKLALLPLALPLMVLGCSTYALAGDDVSVSISTDYVTEYVYRGITLAGEAFQPGAEISVGDFTAGIWTSVAVGEESVFFGDEIDIYSGYSFDVGESISANVGFTLYHYPQLGGVFDIGANDASTFEIYGSLGFATPLVPNVTAYYDFNLKVFTLIGQAEYSFPIGENASFDLGASAGLVTVSGSGDYQYSTLSGALTYGFDDNTSVYAGINGGLSSQDTFSDINFDISNLASISPPKSSSVWFGVGVSSGF